MSQCMGVGSADYIYDHDYDYFILVLHSAAQVWVGEVQLQPTGRGRDGGPTRVEFEAQKVPVVLDRLCSEFDLFWHS